MYVTAECVQPDDVAGMFLLRVVANKSGDSNTLCCEPFLLYFSLLMAIRKWLNVQVCLLTHSEAEIITHSGQYFRVGAGCRLLKNICGARCYP